LLFKIILLDNLENFQRVAREKPTNERNVLIIINALFQQKLRSFILYKTIQGISRVIMSLTD
jgi:hypothetical protein